MKKILYTLAAIIFAPLIVLLIVSHLCVYPIVNRIRMKKLKENKYWNECVKRTPRLSVFLSTSRDLMISFSHFYEGYDYDDETRKYSREIVIHFGGLCIFWKYGHVFLEHGKKMDDDGKTKYYGLYCIDNWHGCWDCIWWGNHLYDTPFMYRTHLSTEVIDWKTIKPINEDYLHKYSDRYDETRKFPYYKVLKHTKYNSKSCGQQDIDWIRFYVIQRRYTMPIAHLLKLDRWIQKTHVSLDWECSPPGIGSGRDYWKGATYRSSINLNLPQFKETRALYDSVFNKGHIHNLSKLKHGLDDIIHNFLHVNQDY